MQRRFKKPPYERIRCLCCYHDIVVVTEDTRPLCAQCAMIAEGRLYSDGSDPAEGLSRGEILYIGTRVRSILHALEHARV